MYKITTKDGTFEAPTADEAIKMALDYSKKQGRNYPIDVPLERGSWPEIPKDFQDNSRWNLPHTPCNQPPDWWRTVVYCSGDAPL